MRIYLRKNKWCIDYRNPIIGKRIREIVGTNKKQAEDRLGKIRSEKLLYDTYGDKEYFENITKQAKQIKFSDMVNIYLDYAKQNKRSCNRDVVLLSHWLEFSSSTNQDKKMKDMYLSEITLKLIEDYKIARIEKVKKSTCNRELACLKHLFNKAIEWDYAKENPVKKVKLFKENNTIVRFLELEQIDKLFEACDSLDKRGSHLKPIVIVALNTGLRKTEILNLKWKNVDFIRNIIYIEQSKNGEQRQIQMNNQVKEALRQVPQYSEVAGNLVLHEYVFRNNDGLPFIDVRTSFKTTLKRAGISNFRFHDLRHTFASHLVMKGVDLATVRELMGHKSIEMTLRYAHLSPDHRQKAIEDLYEKKDGTNMAQEQFKQKA